MLRPRCFKRVSATAVLQRGGLAQFLVPAAVYIVQIPVLGFGNGFPTAMPNAITTFAPAAAAATFSMKMPHLLSFVACLIVCTHVLGREQRNEDTPPRVGIIGSGIGGAAAAYFLKDKGYRLEV